MKPTKSSLPHARTAPLGAGEIVIFSKLSTEQIKHYGLKNGSAGEVVESWKVPDSAVPFAKWSVLVMPLVSLRSGRARSPIRVHRWRLAKQSPIEQLAIMGNLDT